jgi:hypothetical protein
MAVAICTIMFLISPSEFLDQLSFVVSLVFMLVFGVMTAVLVRSFGWKVVLKVGGMKELVGKMYLINLT